MPYGDDDRTRLFKKPHSAHDERSEFLHDRDRIIHSAAFRRLQGKTQVYGLGASDYYRSRLTHSLEVAQIGRGLALKFKADPDLVEAICLAHDIGHPPFGHAGEAKLHTLLRDWGGFNGNAQNLRLMAVLEKKSTNPRYPGLNLTYATLDGLIKYPFAINPKLPSDEVASKKGYYERDKQLVDKFKRLDRKTFECELMNWADDVAYSSHDLEDAVIIGTIRVDDLERPLMAERIAEHAIQNYRKDYPELWATEQLTVAEVTTWIDDVVKNCIQASNRTEYRLAAVKEYVSAHIDECLNKIRAHDITGLDDMPGRYRRKLDLQAEIVKKVESFKSIVFNTVIRTSPVYTLQHAGVQMIEDMFKALTNVQNPNLIYLFPLDLRSEAVDAVRSFTTKTDEYRLFELVRDYIASMTDGYCEALWRRMFSPGGGLFTARA